MTRRVEFEGQVHEFPDDFTDEDIAAALSAAPAPQRRNMPRSSSPTGRRPDAQRVGRDIGPDLARRAVERQLNRQMSPGGIGYLTQPFVDMVTSRRRRDAVGESAQGALRDLQEVPNLDFGQLAQDTGAAAAEGVKNLPRIAGYAATHLPEIGRAVTYGPFVDAERAQRDLDAAELMGDEASASEAARRANARTAEAGLNIVGPLAVGGGNSVARAGATGAALNAPFALSRGEPDAPLQERLPGALTEIGGVGAFAAGTQGIANGLGGLARMRERNTNQTRARAAEFEEAEVRPFLAATEGRGAAPVTMQVAENPAGGNARRNLRAAAQDVENRAGTLASRNGDPVTPEIAGERAQGAVRRFANGEGRGRSMPQPRAGDPASIPVREWSMSDKAEALYGPIFDDLAFDEAAMVGNVDGPIITTEATQRVLNDIMGSVKGPRSAERIISSAIRDMQERLGSDAASGQLRFQDLRQWRTHVRNAQRDEGLRQGMSNANLQRIESALTDDIYRSADMIGGQAGSKLRRVDQWYRAANQRIDGALRQIDEAGGGEQAFRRIRELALSGGRRNTRQLLAIRRSLTPDDWRVVAGAIINDMGKAPKGRAHLGEFDLDTFVTNYQDMARNPEAIQALFGGQSLGRLAADLDNLGHVAGYMKEVRGFTNWSRSGQSMQSFWTQSAVTAAVAAAAVGNFVPALGVAMFLVGTRLTGELLTNPAIVRWLTAAPKAGATPRSARAHLLRLGEISTRNPALAPVVADLSQRGLLGERDQARTPPQRELVHQ